MSLLSDPGSSTPDEVDVLRRILFRYLARTWVSLPAQVLSYDPVTSLAEVQPLLREVQTNQDGSTEEVQLPVLANVPVLHQGGSKFRVRIPIEPGTIVDVLFTDMDLTEWKAGSGGMVTPLDLWRHGLNGAVAIPGLRSNSGAWQGPEDRMTLGPEGGSQLAIGNTLLELGYPNASESVALGDALKTFLDAMHTWLAGLATAAMYATPQPTVPVVSSAYAKVKP